MQKEHFITYDYYKRSEERITQLQTMLEYTYNSRQFWLKMFWLQAITFWLVMILN